jgi:hypothetical protein
LFYPRLVVTDTKGKRSDFMRDAMSGIARARNDDLNRRSFFWDDQPFGDTVLLDRYAFERKLLYTWLNPVVCGVRKADVLEFDLLRWSSIPPQPLTCLLRETIALGGAARCIRLGALDPACLDGRIEIIFAKARAVR